MELERESSRNGFFYVSFDVLCGLLFFETGIHIFMYIGLSKLFHGLVGCLQKKDRFFAVLFFRHNGIFDRFQLPLDTIDAVDEFGLVFRKAHTYIPSRVYEKFK